MLLSAMPAPTPVTSVFEVSTLLLAIVMMMVTATVLRHWRHAVGSIAIPAGLPMLPGSVPLLGHCIPVLSNLGRMHDCLFDSVQQMGEGKTFAFSLPLLPSSIMITDAVCLKHILQHKADNYLKGPYFPMNLGPMLGHGIFTSDGDSWYWQHKLATHIFSVKSFTKYFNTVFEQKMLLLTDVVSAAVGSGQTLDLHDLMYRFTLDSFGQIGFGADLGCLRTAAKVPFAAAFDSAQVIVTERFWMPGWRLLELLTGTGATLRSNVATVKAFALNIIECRCKQLAAATAAGGAVKKSQHQSVPKESRDVAADNSTPAGAAGGGTGRGDDTEGAKDLLSLFMEALGPDGKPLNTQQLIDTVLNFIIAGRDTTAQALSWSFYLLVQHPQVEQKLLDEMHEVLGPAQRAEQDTTSTTDSKGGSGANSNDKAAAAAVDSSGPLHRTYDQLKRLRYARAVFMEALRLYPSVPGNLRYAVHRDVLPDGAVVPAGAQIIYSAYACNRLATTWGPDPLVFRPERWLEMDKPPSPFNYLTFNAGPRLCLGQRLAELQGVFVLTGLLSHFKFRQAVPGTKVTYNLSTTLPLKGGLHVIAEARA